MGGKVLGEARVASDALIAKKCVRKTMRHAMRLIEKEVKGKCLSIFEGKRWMLQSVYFNRIQK